MYSIFSCSGYPSTTSPFFFQPNAQLYLFRCHISKLLCAFLFIVGIHLFVQICIANISLTTLKDKYNILNTVHTIVRKSICIYQGMLASNSHARLNPMFVCVEVWRNLPFISFSEYVVLGVIFLCPNHFGFHDVCHFVLQQPSENSNSCYCEGLLFFI